MSLFGGASKKATPTPAAAAAPRATGQTVPKIARKTSTKKPKNDLRIARGSGSLPKTGINVPQV